MKELFQNSNRWELDGKKMRERGEDIGTKLTFVPFHSRRYSSDVLRLMAGSSERFSLKTFTMWKTPRWKRLLEENWKKNPAFLHLDCKFEQIKGCCKNLSCLFYSLLLYTRPHWKWKTTLLLIALNVAVSCFKSPNRQLLSLFKSYTKQLSQGCQSWF